MSTDVEESSWTSFDRLPQRQEAAQRATHAITSHGPRTFLDFCSVFRKINLKVEWDSQQHAGLSLALQLANRAQPAKGEISTRPRSWMDRTPTLATLPGRSRWLWKRAEESSFAEELWSMKTGFWRPHIARRRAPLARRSIAPLGKFPLVIVCQWSTS